MSSVVNNTLKTSREFDLVFKKGGVFHTKFFVVFFLEAEETKVGFVASKKVGKATVRNRAKRRLRSLFREVSLEKNGYYVLVSRAGADTASYLRMRDNLKFALKKLITKKPNK